jgi:esterase/lipase superfamily enzyme
MKIKNETLAIALGAAMSFAPSLWAQGDSRVIAQGDVGAYETVKTPVFSLGRGEAVSLSTTRTGAGEAQPLIPELYDSDAILLAKLGEEEKEPFHWSAPKEGRYYMRIRNVTEVPAHYEVRAVSRGRRGPVTPVANFAEIRVYYATNRKPTGDASPAAYFSGEPAAGNKLSLGEATVSVPRDLVHHMGELEGPSVFRIFNIKFGAAPDPQSQFLVTHLSPSTNEATFFEHVAKRVKASEGKQVLIFIHGFNVSFEEAACRTAQLAYDLRYDGAPITFSWPSQGKPRVFQHIPTLLEYFGAKMPSLSDYLKDADYNQLSIDTLSGFLNDVRLRTGATNIQIIAHSMGNRVLTSALAELLKPGRSSQPFRVNELVLMAADISTTVFRERAPAFLPAASRTTLYASSTDRVLKASEKLNAGPRAGEGGRDIVVLPGIDSIDASAIDTGTLGLNHGYYGDRSSVIYDLNQLVHGVAAGKRLDLHPTRNSQGDYWEFMKVNN